MKRFSLWPALLVAAGACSKHERPVDGSVAASPIGPPAHSSAPAPAPTRFRGDLSALPRGGAIYLSVNAPMLDVSLALLPPDKRARLERELATELGLDASSAPGLLEQAGIDPTRPLLLAVLPGDSAAAKQILERVKPASDLKELAGARAALDELPLPMSGAFRMIVPVEDGGATKLLAVIERAAPRGIRTCPGADGCSAFGARAPLAIVDFKSHWIAVHDRPGAVVVDAVALALGDEGDVRSVERLAHLAGLEGGPEEGVCSTFDTKAHVSVCFRPDAAADLGTSSGYGMVLGAISSDSLDEGERRTLFDVGMEEAERNRELARPKTRLLDDGVVRVRGDAALDQVIEMDWATTADSKIELQKAFGEPKCAKDGAIATQLLPALMAALSPAKPEFATPAEALNAFFEAGWAAWPIAMGRSWPGFLPLLLEQTGKGTLPFEGTLCAEMKGERFAIRIKPDLPKLLAR